MLQPTAWAARLATGRLSEEMPAEVEEEVVELNLGADGEVHGAIDPSDVAAMFRAFGGKVLHRARTRRRRLWRRRNVAGTLSQDAVRP